MQVGVSIIHTVFASISCYHLGHYLLDPGKSDYKTP